MHDFKVDYSRSNIFVIVINSCVVLLQIRYVQLHLQLIMDVHYYNVPRNDSPSLECILITMTTPATWLQDANANVNANVTRNGTDDAPPLPPRWIDTAYGRRFIPYTLISTSCVLFNVLTLLAMERIRKHCTVHHVLLFNLALCDITGSALLWMYYNSPVLFPRFKTSTLEHCLFITVIIVAPFILALCNSLCSLLMLALNQYVAICDPIFTATKMTKSKVRLGIGVAWVISLTVASIPALAMLFTNRNGDCAQNVAEMGQKSLEICAYAMAGLIIIIIALYGRIYRVVIKYRRSAPRVRRHRTSVAGNPETETNYKAFVTTLLLTGNLVLLWLPYVIFHFISAHVDIESIPDFVLNVKFYFIDFMPMLSFVTDPIIYGIRMREIRLGYHRLFAKLLPCCVKEPRRANFTRTTIRFSTLDSESTVL